MFETIFSLFILQNINGYFTEIEGEFKSTDSDTSLETNLESAGYYWFELQNKIHLAYFNNSSNHHETPFLLFVRVPHGQTAFCSRLVTAFNDFYKTSVFLSLLPNEQNLNYYRILAQIEDVMIEGKVHLGNRTTFVADFTLKRFTDCPLIINSTQIGTRSWTHFYKVEDSFYGLFIGVYYIIYRNPSETSNIVAFFSIGDLFEASFIKLRTHFNQGKVFLISENNLFEVESKEYLFYSEQNVYGMKMPWSKEEFYISFDERENMVKQFSFSLGHERLNEEDVKMFAIERLSKTGRTVYLIRNTDSDKIKIEIPTYSFQQYLKTVKVIIPFKIVVEKPSDLFSVQILFKVCDLSLETNFLHFYAPNEHFLQIDHFVENGHIYFIITNAMDENGKTLAIKSVKEKEAFKGTEMLEVSRFLNGAIVCGQSVVLTPTEDQKNTTERRIKPVSEKDTKNFFSKHKKKVILFVIILILLVVGLFSKLIYPECRKKINQQRKFKRKV